MLIAAGELRVSLHLLTLAVLPLLTLTAIWSPAFVLAVLVLVLLFLPFYSFLSLFSFRLLSFSSSPSPHAFGAGDGSAKLPVLRGMA